VEINNYVVERLVDTGASMSIMVAIVVRELGIMHLVTEFETYKTTSGVVTHTRRKTCIFDCFLQLNFSRKRHFATKILLVA